MSFAWVCYVLIIGALVDVGAHALDGIARAAKLPTRWIWIGALGLTAAFAVLAPEQGISTQSRRSLLALPSPTRQVVTSLAPLTPMERTRALWRTADAALASALATASRSMSAVSYGFFLATWVVMSAALLSLVVIISRRADRAKRQWPRATLLDTHVRIAPGAGPAVIGLTTPDIVLPSWILEREREEQRIVLAHERAHVAAHDQLLPVAGWLIAALLPWHPAVWWMVSRLRLAIELDCDARVLTREGIEARPYGALLIDIAQHCAPFRLGALALADAPSHLERRLVAMKNKPGRFATARIAALGGIAALALAAACESRMPTAAQVESMDVASAERMATQAHLIGAGSKAVYLLDGAEVLEARVRSLPTDSIGSVEIVKKPALRVSITTKAKMMANGTSDAEREVLPGELRATVDGRKVTPEETRAMIAKPEARYMAKMTTQRIAQSDTNANGTIAVGSMRRTIVGSGASPVFIIDDKYATEAQMGRLSPSEIESVEVIKGVMAGRFYGNNLEKFAGAPAGTTSDNGVILVKTKKSAR